LNKVQSQVHRYYEATTADYLKYYQTGWHHHMHYGFDRDLPKGGNPAENLLRYLAKLAKIKAGEKILDAGCGVGGSAIFLARALGCHCLGITLVESQARLAKKFAATGKAGGIEHRRPNSESESTGHKHSCAFIVNDFHTPAFKLPSFDVVWAVESFDHADDKKAWVKTMFDILKPGGRLLIADGFSGTPPKTMRQEKAYAHFLKGWAVPHLCSIAEIQAYGKSAGFTLIHQEDITSDIRPHARAIYRFGLLFIPIRWVLWKLSLTSLENLGNAYATFFQYRTLKLGLWNYGVFCFQKPE
jgi:tocopherol O-methyltransferase